MPDREERNAAIEDLRDQRRPKWRRRILRPDESMIVIVSFDFGCLAIVSWELTMNQLFSLARLPSLSVLVIPLDCTVGVSTVRLQTHLDPATEVADPLGVRVRSRPLAQDCAQAPRSSRRCCCRSWSCR